MATLADVKVVGKRIYDQDNDVDVRALAAAIARTVGPGGAVYAGVAAKEIIDAGKKAGSVVTAPVRAVSDAAGVVRDAAELPTRVLSWLTDPPTWERIAYVLGGGVLILIAARMFLEKPIDATVSKVAGITKTVATKGKA